MVLLTSCCYWLLSPISWFDEFYPYHKKDEGPYGAEVYYGLNITEGGSIKWQKLVNSNGFGFYAKYGISLIIHIPASLEIPDYLKFFDRPKTDYGGAWYIGAI